MCEMTNQRLTISDAQHRTDSKLQALLDRPENADGARKRLHGCVSLRLRDGVDFDVIDDGDGEHGCRWHRGASAEAASACRIAAACPAARKCARNCQAPPAIG